MKKVFVIFSVAMAFALTACNKFSQPAAEEKIAPEVESGMLVVSVNPENGSATKANASAVGSAKAEEAITSLQVFVFYASTNTALGQTANAKETDRYETFTGTDKNRSITLTTTVGSKLIYALANAPRLTNVTTVDDLKSRVLNLGHNYLTAQGDGHIGLIMAGAYGYTATQDQLDITATEKEVAAYTQGGGVTTIPINLHRLVSRIELQNVTVDFRNTWLEGLNFTVKDVYLKNVPNGVLFAGNFGTLINTEAYWSNRIQHASNPMDNASNSVASLIYEKRDGDGTVCNVAGNPTSINSYFYTFPNPSDAEPAAATIATWSPRRTVLVIHAQISGKNTALGTDFTTPKDVYYPVYIAAPENYVSADSTTPASAAYHTQIVANHKYVINNINITMLGNDDDVKPSIVTGKAQVDVSVLDWNGTTVLGYDI